MSNEEGKALFFRFLKNHDVFYQYKTNILENRKRFHIINDFFNQSPPKGWLICAFGWNEGYWRVYNKEWEDICLHNRYRTENE